MIGANGLVIELDPGKIFETGHKVTRLYTSIQGILEQRIKNLILPPTTTCGEDFDMLITSNVKPWIFADTTRARKQFSTQEDKYQGDLLVNYIPVASKTPYFKQKPVASNEYRQSGWIVDPFYEDSLALVSSIHSVTFSRSTVEEPAIRSSFTKALHSDTYWLPTRKVTVQGTLLCSVYTRLEGVGVGSPRFHVVRKSGHGLFTRKNRDSCLILLKFRFKKYRDLPPTPHLSLDMASPSWVVVAT
ncbi:hypothetical protein T265_01180 [Opisthorchis viverrini]|uniref:Uncharacterized protein n=1 Tax=Opisthorchis viverrini TaxID=6198 RepID=A0A075AAR9_OPIVI|nr:hypothetical protein T265_01180 [Opisthorchis viverrini]KER32900.1 hypothetical protein T265_01180 [Opisthorchis viverrini]